MVVPTITGQTSLRIKLLSNEEWDTLPPPSEEKDRFEHGVFHYQFSSEVQDLSKTPGVLVSVWKNEDLSVLCSTVTYDFGITLYEVYKDGFGPRCTTDCAGVNAYRAATYSNRAHPSPGFGQEQIAQQQYYRQKQSFPLIQALIEKRLHYHTHAIIGSATNSNPSFTKFIHDYCKKTIVTCGSPPFAVKETKCHNVVRTKNKKPTLGFHNDLHVDHCDKLTKDLQLQHQLECMTDPSLCRLFERFKIGLPTTCGYQFLFNLENPSINPANLCPMQYFSCDGLGLAVQIQHGRSHSFLGWVFSHRTTACILYDSTNLQLYLNNLHDIFMVYAWGRTGGSKEVKAYSESKQQEE